MGSKLKRVIPIVLSLLLVVLVSCQGELMRCREQLAECQAAATPEPDIEARGVAYGQFMSIRALNDILVDDDLSVDGTTDLDDLDIDLTSELEIDGALTDFGGCTAGVADGDNDVCIAAVLEVDGEIEADGAIDADSDLDVDGTTNLDDVDIDLSASLNIDGHMVDIGTCTTPSAADGDNDLCVAAVLEVDGELEADGNIDADADLDVDGTSNLDEVDIDGVTNLIVGTEHIGIPSIVSTAITYTAAAGGTGAVATIADGEIWFVWAVFVNVTTNFDVTGEDATLVIGDGLDPNGFVDLADAELQAADTEQTGSPAGWQGLVAATMGVYLDGAVSSAPHIYAPSGSPETIDWLLDETSGETYTAGAATIYVIYTRIQ
jgi:hypothetical protein